jgi:hypothetical protein
MAISYVGGQTAGRAGNTGTSVVTFSFSGGSNTTPSAGDLVVVTIVVGSAGRNPMIDLSAQGYTNLTQLNPNTASIDTSLCVCYKIMGGTPDTTVTMPSTGNNADAQRWSIQCFRGVDATTPMDVTPVSATGINTTRADPAAITPVTAGAWIVICAGGAAATATALTFAALTNVLSGATADTNDAVVGSGYYTAWTSGAYDPAASSTGSAVAAADSWAAYTLALRPTVHVLNAGPGSFAITGTNATLARALNLNAAPASFTLTGADASFSRGFTMNAAPGSFTLTGSSSTMTAARSMNAGPASCSITGADATLARSFTSLNAEPASFVYTGFDATLDYSADVAPGAVLWDTFVWDNFYWDRAQLDAEVGAFTLSGSNATLSRGYAINAGPDSYAITGNDVTFRRTYAMTAEPGAFAITGAAAAMTAVRTVNAQPASYSITGQAATFVVAKSINAALGSFALTGAAATFRRDLSINAAPGSFALTGANATLGKGSVLAASPGSYALNGANAGLAYAHNLNAGPGSFTIAGATAQVLAARSVNAAAGAFSISVADASFVIARSIVSSPEGFNISGFDAELTYSGGTPPAVNDQAFEVSRFRARR